MQAKPIDAPVRPPRQLLSLVRAICAEQHYRLDELSDGWLLQISQAEQQRWIYGNSFDIDRAASQKVAADKVATAAALAAAAVPHIEHRLVYGFGRGELAGASVWQPILAYQAKHQSVVAKALQGSGGSQVYLCHSGRELESACQQLFSHQPAISLSPYYSAAHEYRLMMFDGDCYLAYQKTKAHLWGDGKHSVAQLIAQQAQMYDERGAQRLQGLRPPDSERVLAAGELYVLNHKHNLSQGATLRILEPPQYHPRLLPLAQRAMRALGLRFASVDILALASTLSTSTEEESRHEDDPAISSAVELRVLEVNSGVMVDNLLRRQPQLRARVQAMYTAVIRAMMED